MLLTITCTRAPATDPSTANARTVASWSTRPLDAWLPCLPCRSGETWLRQVFEPLGYAITAASHALSADFPAWGPSRCWSVRLTATVPLQRLLQQVYVLIPVLDDGKHYWLAPDEVDKLLKHGGGWLAAHPERERIVERALKRLAQAGARGAGAAGGPGWGGRT